MKQYAAIDDTVYFWFGANDTSGSGGDGASPAADVRLAGAAADAIPVYSPTPTLLSHANYPAGAYEIAITASAANGFATDNTYAVFCTLAIDSQNPTGFVGSFDTKPVESNTTQIGDVSQSATDLKDMVDTGYDPTNHKIQSDLIYIHGSALTETAGQLAAAFTKLFDVATPLLVASDVMRGTDSAAPAATALTDVTWTDAKAAFLDHSITTVDTVVDGIQTDLDNATDGLGALKALIDTVDGIVDAILLDTGTDGVVVATASKTGYALTATGADLILKDSLFMLAIANAVWDAILTGTTHNIATSAGRRVREIGAYAIHSGIAQAGDSVHITLAATASAVDGIYNRNLLVLIDGTGAQQTRTIIDYNGTTKIATIDREWRVNPDATSEYQIVADDTPLVVDQGIAQAGSTLSTIKLREYASSTDNIYLCNIVSIVAGTGRGQARLVGGYNGTTKVVTVCGDDWITTPDNTSVYIMMPYGTTCVSCVGDDALAQINTECDTALTDYDGPTRTEATSDKNEIITEVDANKTKIDTLQTDSTAIKAKTDNLPSGIAKNVALPKFDIFMVLSSDHVTSATGKTITGEISKDGGSFTGITNAITEVGSGVYVIADGLTQTEMNADIVTLKFTETDCDQRTITIHTT